MLNFHLPSAGCANIWYFVQLSWKSVNGDNEMRNKSCTGTSFLEVSVANSVRSRCGNLENGFRPGLVTVQLNCEGEAVGSGTWQEAPEQAQRERFSGGGRLGCSRKSPQDGLAALCRGCLSRRCLVWSISLTAWAFDWPRGTHLIPLTDTAGLFQRYWVLRSSHKTRL